MTEFGQRLRECEAERARLRTELVVARMTLRFGIGALILALVGAWFLFS